MGTGMPSGEKSPGHPLCSQQHGASGASLEGGGGQTTGPQLNHLSWPLCSKAGGDPVPRLLSRARATESEHGAGGSLGQRGARNDTPSPRGACGNESPHLAFEQPQGVDGRAGPTGPVHSWANEAQRARVTGPASTHGENRAMLVGPQTAAAAAAICWQTRSGSHICASAPVTHIICLAVNCSPSLVESFYPNPFCR